MSKHFIKVDDGVYTTCENPEIIPVLKPGMYSAEFSGGMQPVLLFKKITNTHDGIIDLKDTAYSAVVDEIETFLNPATKAKFAEHNFVYKRSTLLHGKPGTGKTVLVNRLANLVKEKGGITLFNVRPNILTAVYEALNATQPETLTLVIFEELDTLCEHYESDLLNLLDGEIQKRNVIYVATTNFLDLIPGRIRRPGRFSSVVEVGMPSADARAQYLVHRTQGALGNEVLTQWVKDTEGFSIDELSETVKSHICLGSTLPKVIEKIKTFKKTATSEDYIDPKEEEPRPSKYTRTGRYD